MTNKRLVKEYKDIIKEPIENIYTRPLEENILMWNYIIFADNESYKGGVYHGVIELTKDYPMKPPSIKMYTPSGRFETNVRICLSMSDYHPETWNPSWGIKTILLGLYSFMIDDEFSEGTIGSIKATHIERVKFSENSMIFNEKNDVFNELYSEYSDNIAEITKPEQINPSCRYCFEESGILISPCNCLGTNKYVHKECLAKWQYSSILAQSTHPKYQTNIEEICNVCNSKFNIIEHSRDTLMLQFTGKEIADTIFQGSYLVSSIKSSEFNIKLLEKHKNDNDLCQNLKHWTKAVFLVTNIQTNTIDTNIIGVSLTNVLELKNHSQFYFSWLNISRNPYIQNIQKKNDIPHYVGGPCDSNTPYVLLEIPDSKFNINDITNSNISLIKKNQSFVLIFGLLNGVKISLLESCSIMKVFWGIAGWSKTQLLGEIAKGGWGVNKPVILNNLEDDKLWNYFIEKESVIFSGENDYSKMFKADGI